MAVGIDLTGRFRKKGFLSRTPPPQKCLDALHETLKRESGDVWLNSQSGQGPDAHPALGLTLHPAAESVQITALDAGRVSVSANTSSAGPGYHAHLCDLLRRAGDQLNIDWDTPNPATGSGDPTGYLQSRDFSAVRREMLSWLRNVANNLREFLDDNEHTGLAVSLPAEIGFHHDGALATVTGPRSAQWVREVTDEPARGADLFPWWDQGAGAAYHLGRALALMWTEVRWRRPQSDAARAVIQDVLKSLRRAHELDPSLDYPWREWHELNEIAAITGALPDAVAKKAAAAPERPPIGYRRRDVTARLTGSWSIDVPGSFETIDNAESWQAFDETRVVYFSSLAIGGGPDGPPPAEKLLTTFPAPEGKLLQTYEHRGSRVIGKAALVEVEESGRTLWRLSATSAVPGGVGISTIDLYDASYRDWAVATWKSVDHPTE